MDEGKSWLRTNWRTAVILVLIFGLALFLRVYFVYGLAFPLPHVNCDSIYTLPKAGIGRYRGSLDRAKTARLNAALAIALGLD